MKRVLFVIQVLLSIHLSMGYGQTVLFSEGFESGELPLGWTQTFTEGAINWRYENGGYTYSPAVPNSRQPITAHNGVFNALFQFMDINVKATKLNTKKIGALEFAIKPELHFYNAQFAKSGYNDKLKVYYKNSFSSPWTLLQSYNEPTTDWVERIILLPEGSLSADYYLAFEGEISNLGYGTCVDDIRIIETGLLQKYLSEISVDQASVVSIGSGSINNPILRFNLKVMGNSGTLPLNSVVLNSLNTSDNDIESGGVKLFLTTDTEFNTDNPVGTGQSFESGQAIFSNLSYDLPTGYSYLWVTYDVKTDAGHRDIVDARLLANVININGLTFFPQEISPEGSRTILRTLNSTDFESDMDWELTGEFEYGSPLGLGGTQGNPDPDNAFSGANIIGTDLTGMGDHLGDYEINLGDNEYSATSDTMDFTYYNDLSLRYLRYLNIGINDVASIDISTDRGNTWKEAWSNSTMILDDTWKLHEIDINSLSARKKEVLVRYSIRESNHFWQLSGWNIDDFSVTGNYVTKDVGISRIVSPMEGCGHTEADIVSVMVKNYGAEDSYGVIPLQYSLNGNQTIFMDTLYQVIPFGDSVLFTFKKKADLSVPDIYGFRATTRMNDDDDASNDGIIRSFYVQPTLAEDDIENFESKEGLWMNRPLATSSWEWGAPGFGLVPPSGAKLWMTRLVNNYPDNDSSYIESVCYKNTDGNRKVIQLNYWISSETQLDGACVQFSTDNGLHWNVIDTLVSGWNWSTDSVAALKTVGWSDISGDWITARNLLPVDITNAPEMKFRLTFGSDAQNNDIGFAFDDFSIINAPPDIGVSKIDSFADRCQNINPDRLTVTIKNYGLNPVKKDKPVIVGFDFNQVHMKIDTFNLANDLLPGHTVKHTFQTPVDVSDPGNYNLTAFTLLEEDPYYYVTNNDTTSLDFEVLPNPFTMLMDTIQTREPDTVLIRPILHPDYDYLWGDLSTGPTFDVDHEGLYKVKVTATRGNGCSSYDSTFVQLLFFDVGIDSLLSPFNHCGLSNHEYLRVRVRNFGTDSIASGEKIALNYSLNSGLPIKDTLLLSNTLYANHTTNFTITKGSVDMTVKGMYHFKVYANFDGDTIADNDTLVKQVEIYGHPVVNIGPDKTVKDLSYTLDAGNDFISYAWDNGALTQTRVITVSGSYWVLVTDENNCNNKDTATIRLKIRDISPSGFTSPGSDCRLIPAEQVSLTLMNSGTDTIPSGEQIQVSYIANGGTRVQESLNLSADLLPGSTIVYNFAGKSDLTNAADYDFEGTAATANDLRTINDTTSMIIYRYPAPVVDFGLDPIEYIEDIEFNIEAGDSPFYTYAWQDDFTGHVYNATKSGIYRVLASDTRTACTDGDTVTLFLIYTDVGVVSSGFPTEGCTGVFKNISVGIRNLGSSNIGKDVPIYVACDVNGVRISLDTLVRAGNFATNSTLNLVMSGNIPVSESGNSSVDFYTIYGADMKPWNDTLNQSFDALPAPVIDFNDENGVLNTDLPHTLDAGSGHKYYLWQDGSISQMFTVNQKGIYSVTVTGQNDCQTNYTISINPVTGFGTEASVHPVIMYPNPNHGSFRISLDGDTDEAYSMIIVNMQGQTVYTRTMSAEVLQNETIDVQHLFPGIYRVLISNNKQFYMGNMIVE